MLTGLRFTECEATLFGPSAAKHQHRGPQKETEDEVVGEKDGYGGEKGR